MNTDITVFTKFFKPKSPRIIKSQIRSGFTKTEPSLSLHFRSGNKLVYERTPNQDFSWFFIV